MVKTKVKGSIKVLRYPSIYEEVRWFGSHCYFSDLFNYLFCSSLYFFLLIYATATMYIVPNPINDIVDGSGVSIVSLDPLASQFVAL